MIDFESEKIHEKCGVLGVFLDKAEKSNTLSETCYFKDIEKNNLDPKSLL